MISIFFFFSLNIFIFLFFYLFFFFLFSFFFFLFSFLSFYLFIFLSFFSYYLPFSFVIGFLFSYLRFFLPEIEILKASDVLNLFLLPACYSVFYTRTKFTYGQKHNFNQFYFILLLLFIKRIFLLFPSIKAD